MAQSPLEREGIAQMPARWFYMTSGALLITISLTTLSLMQKAVGKVFLIFVAMGVLRTESILDVPRYAFAGSVAIELLGLCIGLLLVGRSILCHQ